MQAPTAPGMKRPLLVPGDTALVLAKVSQAGDLQITSITPDRPVDRSPGSTQGHAQPVSPRGRPNRPFCPLTRTRSAEILGSSCARRAGRAIAHVTRPET
jgi:hypothetical protein